MEEDFVFLPFFFYFFTWMAVAHIHTSNTKRSFHEISRLYDNKYNTSNYYVDAYVKTHTLHYYNNNNGVRYRGSSYIYQSIWATTSFLSHSLSYIPFLLKLTPVFLSVLCFLSPWNSKLIIFYCIPCDLIIW